VVFLEGAWGIHLECNQFHRPFSTLRNLVLQGLILSGGSNWDSSQSQSHITTDNQSASPSWCQAPIWDPRPLFLSPWDFLLDSYCLLFYSALSDERTGLEFTVVAGPHQPVRVRVTLQLTVSRSPAELTALFCCLIWDSVQFQSESELHYNWQSVSQSVSQYVLVSSPIWDFWPEIFFFFFFNLLSCHLGAPSLTRSRVCPLSVLCQYSLK
jgi:hypothetical protein